MYDLGEGEPRDVGGWPRELEYPQEALFFNDILETQ